MLIITVTAKEILPGPEIKMKERQMACRSEIWFK